MTTNPEEKRKIIGDTFVKVCSSALWMAVCHTLFRPVTELMMSLLLDGPVMMLVWVIVDFNIDSPKMSRVHIKQDFGWGINLL